MATRTNKDKIANPRSSCKPCRPEKAPTPQKKSTQITRRTESAPPNRIELRGPEVTLLPHDEQECQKIYDKLQRLQPNGACVDLNTLRRALYPPIGTTTYSSNLNNDQTTAFKSYRQR